MWVVALVACNEPPPAGPVEDSDEPEPVLGEGSIPYEFPVVATSARAGDFVLAPSPASLERALQEGGSVATYAWAGATMVEPGAAESRIRSAEGEVELPNSLVLPIARGATAAVGDIVLGDGLLRGVVVGGTPTEPLVRPLDVDGPEIGWAADHFVALAPGGVGVTTACRRDDAVHRGILVAQADGRLLTLERAGHLFANAVRDCMPLDPKGSWSAGDGVQIPREGVFAAATVVRVDESIGRVFVEFEDREVGVAIVDVAAALDRFGQGFAGAPPDPSDPTPEPGRSGKGGKGKKAGKGKR